MAIEVRCEDCDLSYRVPDTGAGRRIKCRRCDRILPVPAATKPNGPPRKVNSQARLSDEDRDRALFDDQFDVDSSPAYERKTAAPAKPKPLPPKAPPAVVRSPAEKKATRRRRGPQVGGSTRDKLVFAGGVLGALGLLAVFAPFVLYLIGLVFYWLAYIWVVGDAWEENSDAKPATGNLFILFRLLTRPLHLWPAWVFLGLGVLAMFVASQRLPWLVDS